MVGAWGKTAAQSLRYALAGQQERALFERRMPRVDRAAVREHGEYWSRRPLPGAAQLAIERGRRRVGVLGRPPRSRRSVHRSRPDQHHVCLGAQESHDDRSASLCADHPVRVDLAANSHDAVEAGDEVGVQPWLREPQLAAVHLRQPAGRSNLGYGPRQALDRSLNRPVGAHTRPLA
jgi:hypothetical protein